MIIFQTSIIINLLRGGIFMRRRCVKQLLGIVLTFVIACSMFGSVTPITYAQENESVDVHETVASDSDAVGDVEQADNYELMTTASYDDTKAYEVLAIVNQERANYGLSPLSMDAELFNAAKIRAAETSVLFSHTRPDGTMCYTVSSKVSGENIAYGYGSASAVMTGWMNSTGHRDNILTAGYKSIGVSCYNYNGILYWVQLFGYGEASDGNTNPTPNPTPVSDTVYNGVDYSVVYDYDYYVTSNPDIKAAFGTDKAATLQHFVNYGMNEGRQAKSTFNVYSYAYKYSDLRRVYGNDLKKYYIHYINYGSKEGRVATGVTSMQNYTTVYNGVDYSAVYDGAYYCSRYKDIKKAFVLDDSAMLKHFVEYGMNEGRQAKSTFNVYSYAYKYSDLRRGYGNDLKKYYIHYINYGSKEGRAATGTTSMQGYTTVYNGVDYSAVYDGGYYSSHYSDLKRAYGLDDYGLLKHFVEYGMKEGRQAKSSFNVYSYAYKYADLRRAYKNDLKAYYTHFINYGSKEGRVATGTTSMQGCTTVYNGIDYSAVYNGTYYSSHNADLRSAFGLDDTAMINHFVNYGMKEGRQAIAGFNVKNYKARYADLRRAYKNDLKAYYMHYINYGRKEGRNGK